MSDEAPRTEDTPTPDSDTPDIPWQKRYEDLRPEFDRTTQALKDEQAIWEDEQALIARIAEKHPHLVTDEEEDDPNLTDELDEDEDDTPSFLTRAEFEQHQAQQAVQEADRRFLADVERLSGDRELSEFGREAITARYMRGEIKGPDDLQKVITDWFSYEDGLSAAEEAEQGKPKRKPPHVRQPGNAVTDSTPDWDKMSEAEINRYMAERAQALAQ